jgi:SAM-dependent methyltransferase
MKLHLGCGDIYLKGYVNVDAQGIMASKVSMGELLLNMTTLDKYFKYPFGSPRREVIVDSKMFLNHPWYQVGGTVDHIVMISCLEHFTKSEGEFIISEVKRVLVTGGTFIVSVPDIKRQVEMFYDSKPDWCMELIYCNGKNEYSLHKWGYTDDTFRALWNDNYKVEKIDLIKHEYPMLQYQVTKL